MAIRVDGRVEKQLRWFCSGAWRNEIGFPIKGGETAADLQTAIQSSPHSKVPSESQRRACEEYDDVNRRWARCEGWAKATLMRAFGPLVIIGLDAYGQYPGVVVCTPAAATAREGSTYSLENWLVRKATVAAGKCADRSGRPVGKREQEEADRVVAHLRTCAEKQLAAALKQFEAPFEEVQSPDAASLRQIARALDWNHETVAAELQRRGIEFSRREGKNTKVRVPLATLWLHWREAAERLGASAA